jgi:hypothetical protein
MKILKFSLFVLVFCSLIFVGYADEFNPLVYNFTAPEVTVTFSELLETSPDRQEHIAEEIAGIASDTMINPHEDTPNNLICTIFGHDLAPQTTVTATHHKVNQYNPRCLMEVYHVTYCKRCDYGVSELYNDFFIICCPED